MRRLRRVSLLAIFCGMGSPAFAETRVVNPCTFEAGIGQYQLSIPEDKEDVKKTYSQAITQILSYAPGSSYALTSGAAISGRDLVVGMFGGRWFPLDNARVVNEREGAVERERSSAFKPFVSGHLEYGKVKSTYVYDQQKALELTATFFGIGVSVGARFDFTSRLGLGVEVGASQWQDSPSSSLILNSTVVENRVSLHFNF